MDYFLNDDINPDNPDFVDNFNRLIEESHNRWLEKCKSNPNYPNEEKEKPQTKVKKYKPMGNIFKEPPSWKPPNFYGKEFDELKILKHQRNMNNWEIVFF